MSDHHGERIHQPTPRKQQQAQAEGHVAQSHDLNAAVILSAGFVVGLAMVSSWLAELTLLAQRCWSAPPGDPAGLFTSNKPSVLGHLLGELGIWMLILAVVSLVISWVQTGFLCLPGRLVPDWTRLNPLAGLRRLGSWNSASRILGSVAKLLSLMVIGAAWALLCWPRTLAAGANPHAAAALLGIVLVILLAAAGGTLLLHGLADLPWQRWRRKQSLRMTEQELREEALQSRRSPQAEALQEIPSSSKDSS